MTDIITTEWLGNMVLETDFQGYKVRMDADESFGGTKSGPRPKPLLLSALSGCTAMDVIAILGKKKVAFDTFRISVSGEMTDDHPKVYRKIHLEYKFSGKDFMNNVETLEKVRRAVQLSFDNYCGIAAMLKKSCELTYGVSLENS